MKKTRDSKRITLPDCDGEKAIEDVYADRWMKAMLCGDFAAAWNISDELLPTIRVKHPEVIWDGSPVNGKRVLVGCHHGLGDTIQFIRYAALLKKVASEVIVWAQPSLIPLLRSVKGIDQLVPLHHGMPNFEYDIELEIGELPYIFRTTMASIPAEIPYIFVEPTSLKPEGRFRVGLIWQSGNWNPRRSIPFSEIERLTKVPGIEWHILQRDACHAGWDGKFGAISGGDNPFEDAGTMRALDLIISVDTMTAHLAGALGQPIWTLLLFDADWRWMLDRNDSPWYPTMRLFRQREEGRWDAVIDEVGRELRLFAARDGHLRT